MALDFGWKKKALHLRMTILSAGHQPAKELPPGIAQILELFRHTALTGDGRGLKEKLDTIPRDADPLLWEPAEIYGWRIQASMYRQDGDLWWLVHAVRKNADTPVDRDIRRMDSILELLGASPSRALVIGPSSSPPGEPPLPFGWWTWKNHEPLYEVQVKGYGKTAQMRIVPLGSRATDGYASIDLTRDPS